MARPSSQGIPFFTKVTIIFSIIAVTLAYSIYQKKVVDKLVSSSGPILKQLPDLRPKEFQKDAVVDSDRLFQGGNPLAMVHFWGTWCAPCEVELPSFIEFAKKFGPEELKVLLLAVNDDEDKMAKHLRRFGQLPENILVAHDPQGELLAQFGTVKVPETYLFGRTQKNLYKFTGPQDWDRESYLNRVRFYLEAQKAEASLNQKSL